MLKFDRIPSCFNSHFLHFRITFFFFQKLKFDIFHKLLTICCFSLYMIWEAKFWTLIRTIIIYQKEHIVVKSAVIGWFVWRFFPIPILFVGIVFTRHLVWHIRKFLLFMEPKGNWLSFTQKKNLPQTWQNL